MKTFAATLLFALISTVVQAAPDATLATVRDAATTRYNLNNAATLTGYVRVALDGWDGPAYRLMDNAVRADANAFATLMFNDSGRLVAVGFARPTAAGVEVMDLESLSFWHLNVVDTVASR